MEKTVEADTFASEPTVLHYFCGSRLDCKNNSALKRTNLINSLNSVNVFLHTFFLRGTAFSVFILKDPKTRKVLKRFRIEMFQKKL